MRISADSLMGVPLCDICHFSLVAFNILSLIFVSFITMCLGVFLLGFILPGSLYASRTWLTISFPILGKFSAIISSNIFSDAFSLPLPSGTSIMRMLACLMLYWRSFGASLVVWLVKNPLQCRKLWFNS